MFFNIGLLMFILISLIELNPYRYRGTKAHQNNDKYSGILITTSSITVGLVSILDYYYEFSTLNNNHSNTLQLVALVLFAIGFTIRTTALHSLGENFSYAAAPLTNKIKTRGAYKIIRHPAYLGTCLYGLATPLLFTSQIGLIFGILVIASVVYRINVEEKLLLAMIPDYQTYSSKTWKLIPLIY